MTAARTTTAPAALMPVARLGDWSSRAPEVVGAKAAALARARAAGLPVLPGFTITTSAAAELAGGTASDADIETIRWAWHELSDGGARPLVVRSSSVAEDSVTSSMAGMFTSVLDVRGWRAFVDAASTVVHSAGDAPMAVLVQPVIEPEWGGVLFGADPITGRSDRLVLAAVPGGPDRLVSGQVDGVHATLSPRGRLHHGGEQMPAELRRRRTLRQLAGLARTVAATFGAPQDIEWAIDGGSIVLLQSRPITALGYETRASGPLYGPGPVAETFGGRVRPLEEDLWVTPLRDGLREALQLVGAKPARQLRSSPIVIVVGGWVAADLDALGVAGERRSWLARFDPRQPARRLMAAWRVGRLKVALPALADDLIADVDADLRSLPEPSTLATSELV